MAGDWCCSVEVGGVTFSPLIRTVPILPPSQNQLLRMHWAQRSRISGEWFLLIPNNPEANRSTQKMRVEFVFQKTRGPKSDPDNLVARVKIPLDALVRRGWITDDDPTHLDLHVSEVITGGKTPYTVIAVSEFEQAREAA